MLALRGRRLATTFGEWRGWELEQPPEDPGDWQTIDRFDNIVRRAKAGNLGDLALLETLRLLERLHLDSPEKPP
jgi:hypothetical protein